MNAFHLARDKIRQEPVCVVHAGEEVHGEDCASFCLRHNPGLPRWSGVGCLDGAGEAVLSSPERQFQKTNNRGIGDRGDSIKRGEVHHDRVDKIRLERCKKLVVMLGMLRY